MRRHTLEVEVSSWIVGNAVLAVLIVGALLILAWDELVTWERPLFNRTESA